MAKKIELLGPPIGYTDLIDYEITEKLTKENEGRKARTLPAFNPLRPSSAGNCARRLAYELMEYRGYATYEKPIQTPATYRLLELGRAIEYHVLRYFQLLKVVQQKYKQQTLSFFPVKRAGDLAEELVEGSCDFVFWSPKFKSVGDVKSKKDKWSSGYKSGWDEEIARFQGFSSLVQLSDTAFYADDLEAFVSELGDDFFTDNFMQLNLYAMSPFLVERGIDHAFIYRYNKNDSRHLEIRFRPSAHLAKQVEDKFNRVSLAVDIKTPNAISRDYHLGSMRCAFCPFTNECHGGENSLTAWFQTLPAKNWPEDIGKMKNAELEKAFKKYDKLTSTDAERSRLESFIIKTMAESKTEKIRISPERIYELKYLKSPRPHFELRRGKL